MCLGARARLGCGVGPELLAVELCGELARLLVRRGQPEDLAQRCPRVVVTPVIVESLRPFKPTLDETLVALCAALLWLARSLDRRLPRWFGGRDCRSQAHVTLVLHRRPRRIRQFDGRIRRPDPARPRPAKQQSQTTDSGGYSRDVPPREVQRPCPKAGPSCLLRWV